MQHLFETYQFVNELARKKNSSIYLAHVIQSPEQDVIVKVLPSLHITQEQDITRFAQEVEFINNLQHPDILPLLGYGIEREHPYLVMPHIPEGSLKDLIAKAPLSISEALRILRQVGQILSFVHERGGVHGNIKAGNVFRQMDGKIWLSDFQCCFVSSDNAQVAVRPDAETAAYMAPEQFEGEVSPASDQYGLACLAYELLTGSVPFPAVALSTSRLMHTTKQPPSLVASNGEISPVLEQAILRALSKDPAQRYADITAFLENLQMPLAYPKKRRTISFAPAGGQATGIQADAGQQRRFDSRWFLALSGQCQSLATHMVITLQALPRKVWVQRLFSRRVWNTIGERFKLLISRIQRGDVVATLNTAQIVAEMRRFLSGTLRNCTRLFPWHRSQLSSLWARYKVISKPRIIGSWNERIESFHRSASFANAPTCSAAFRMPLLE